MVKYSSLGGMAQLVEHSLHMRGVTGSSPVVSTNNPKIGLFFYTTDSNGDYIAFAQCLRNLRPRSHCTRLTFGNNRC